jgi:hypothetical protein
MQRISTPTRQVDKWGPGLDGFSDGNPQVGLPSTQLEANWYDNTQEEICRAIELSGLVLDTLPPPNSDMTQLYQAILRIARGVAGAYLPLAGGTLTGPLLLHGMPTINEHAANKAYVDLVAGGTPPDLSVFVQKIGDVMTGQLNVPQVLLTGMPSNPNMGFITTNQPDMALSNASGGSLANLHLSANTVHVAGAINAGGNIATGVANLISGGTLSIVGRSTLSAGFLAGNSTIDGNLTVNYAIEAGGLITTNALTVNGNGISYPTLGSTNRIGFLWDGTNLVHRIDGQQAGGFWATTLGATNGSFSELAGNNITGHAQVVTNYFRCTTADIQGNTVIGGQLDINGGGFIYALNRCYRGYEINLDPGGIFSAAHGASYQGGPWNTALVLHTRAEAIEPYEHGLAALRQLQPMIYSERRLIGIASEDYRGPMPEMIVHLEVEDDGIAAALRTEPPKTVEGYNGGALTYALVNAVKELAARVEELEAAWPKPAAH